MVYLEPLRRKRSKGRENYSRDVGPRSTGNRNMGRRHIGYIGLLRVICQPLSVLDIIIYESAVLSLTDITLTIIWNQIHILYRNPRMTKSLKGSNRVHKKIKAILSSCIEMSVFSLRTLFLFSAFSTSFSASLVIERAELDFGHEVFIPGSTSEYAICQPTKPVEEGKNRCTLTWVAHSNVKDKARLFLFDQECNLIKENMPLDVTSTELNTADGFPLSSRLPYYVVLLKFDPSQPDESAFWYNGIRYSATLKSTTIPGSYNDYQKLSGSDSWTNGNGEYQVSRNGFNCQDRGMWSLRKRRNLLVFEVLEISGHIVSTVEESWRGVFVH